MADMDPRIPARRTGPVGTVGPRERARRQGVGNAPRESVFRRPFIDPTDIEAAIDRLVRLLSADIDGPREDAPRGYYLNILV